MKFDPVECLKDLVRIDTTNPPGNEQEALRYIKTLLDREQIASCIQETANGRGNLVACIPAARAVKGPNLILLSHIDVVGADPSEWTCPPFEAREIDGYIYGRGTVDTKQLTVMELAAFLNLKTLQKDQNRDVYLVVTCDEESGSECGLKALLQGEVTLKDERITGRALFEHSEVISEGGGFPVLVGGSRFYLCESGQKGAATVKFHVKAKEGNGPFFTSGDGVVRAMDLVKHIGGMELESRRLETVRLFLERLMKAAGAKSEEELSRSLSPFMNKILKAMQQNTMTVTVIEGKNVNETVVTADVRLLPGYGRDYLERVAGELARMYDASYEVESFSEGYESVVEGSLPAALSKCTKAEFSDGRTEFLPFISMGSSDGRFLVPLSARVYGYSPVYDWDMTFDSAVLMVHGRNERIHRDSVGLGSRILTAAVADCVTSGR
ncbi:M20/M25/M40 family metallo-hydrolase [Lachnotalea sp. AF33-28]|uniref:M20/M25/M40 family metallo-hydrolase n=1 Tax=Lachnotalea sp. AF33-28 TaxID=2292046 RepID=UPI000E4F8A57|nr:M20/M25/M40 family metallo-hydrolase [Lachnotalea sp. AF33-28]RHP36540.1 M20/M25/M40 family metallo-hydrolase [Lachnotalea sp. AF33-28]